jgi:hypothetical protein
MRIHMTVKAIGHFLMHCRCVGLAMAGPALWHIRMLAAVAESTGKCLVLGYCFFQLRANIIMTRDT